MSGPNYYMAMGKAGAWYAAIGVIALVGFGAWELFHGASWGDVAYLWIVLAWFVPALIGWGLRALKKRRSP